MARHQRERDVPRDRPRRQPPVARGAVRGERGGDPAEGEDRRLERLGARDARRGDEHEPRHPLRELDRHLGGDVAAHRVADEVDLRRARACRHSAFTHRPYRVIVISSSSSGSGVSPKPGQVHRHDAPVLREPRDVLEPVLPLAAEPVHEHDRLPVAGPDVHVVERDPVDLDRLQLAHPVGVAPVGRRRSGRSRRARRGRATGRTAPHRGESSGVPCSLLYEAVAKIALDIDSTLHHYWDLLQRIAHERYGVDLPYEEQRDWGITVLERDAVVHCVEESHSDENIAAGVPYPDAVETVRELARRRALDPRDEPPARRAPTRPRRPGSTGSGCPSTTSTARSTRSRDVWSWVSMCWWTTAP